MEYKSELIDFEKEDAESKKRMLGSDKVNIEEIKKKVNDNGTGQYCYHADGFYGDMQVNADDDILYLLSIIEQYEHRMKITTVELQDWVRKFEVLVVDKEYMDATKKIIADNYDFHLQAIRK